MDNRFYKTTRPLVDLTKQNSSTASITCYYGDVTYVRRGSETTGFVEIADCRGKVEIHQQHKEVFADYYDKLKTLQAELDAYIKWLDKERDNIEYREEKEKKGLC